MRYELDKMTERPCLTAEYEPRIDIRIVFLDDLEIAYEFIPCVSDFKAERIKNLLVIEESGHCHVGADPVLFSAVHISAAVTH